MTECAFVTEKMFEGKVSDLETNLRVDTTWQKMFDAFHHDLNVVEIKDLKKYDVIFIIYPKSKPIMLNKIKEIAEAYPKNTILIQEGPNAYWCDWDLSYQMLFVDVCNKVAGILCHNASDVFFFKGITTKPVNIIHTVIDWKFINEQRKVQPNDLIFIGAGSGGNWYGGTQSFLAVKDLGLDMVYQKMGRSLGNEREHYKQLTKNKLTELPYTDWSEWIKTVSNYKYAIHLMPTVAAGTFSVNLAALGIPVIGNYLLDSQRTCFPMLSVQHFQIETANELMKKLINDKEFYTKCSMHGIEMSKWFDISNQKILMEKRVKLMMEGKGFDEEMIELEKNLEDVKE